MKNSRLIRELKQELIRNYEKCVRGVAKAAHVSRENARDAIHRAVCRMFEGLGKRSRGNRVLAWQPYILHAGINALRDERREGKRAVRFGELYEDQREKIWEAPDLGPTPGTRLEERERSAILWAEVKSLSRREAEVVKHWAHGSSFGKIAKELGIKPSTVRKLWSRGIQHLRTAPRIRQLAA